MNILPLFPTPVAKVFNFITPKEQLKILERVKKISHISHGAFSGNSSSTHGGGKGSTTPSNFLSREIRSRLHDAANEFTEDYGSKHVEIQNVWSNIQHAGSRLKEHTHPDSIISGVLYLNVDETCKLYFHNPNPYMFWVDKRKATFYNYGYHWIPVENCQLVLFPAWLKHGKNDDDNVMDDRISVGMNFGRIPK